MNVFDLVAGLKLDSSEYMKGLDEAQGKGLGKLQKGLKLFGKASAVAFTASATAIGVMTKKSLDAYANFEQLEGGVRKLYGNGAKELMKFADEAYKTSGMSANQYMETATGFSAALINSLGGDQKKAAQQTDVAMKAISDNYNTFGGDIENVKNAYQGFAKQNYTMLDNLKLGYGGTKTEMERLIKDANEYAKANGQAADLSIDSFSDIVTAIDLIQQKQGIAGTTAKEAATTIEGSTNMMKAAWENLLTGIADDDADFDKMIDNFVESVGHFGDNIIPRVEQIFDGVGKLVQSLIDKLLPKILSTLNKNLPKMVKSITQMVQSVLMALTKALPQFAKAIPDILTVLVDALDENLPVLITAIVEAIPTIAKALIASIPVLVRIIPIMIDALILAIKETLSMFSDIGGQIMSMIGDGIKNKISNVVSSAVNGINKIKTGVAKVWSSLRTSTANGWNRIKDAMIKPITNAQAKIKAIVDKIKNFFPLHVGKIMDNIKVPKINVSGGKAPFGIGGKGKAPNINVVWNAKAMNNPYLFSDATLFGAGETGDEILYGRKSLMEDIKEATGEGGNNYYFTTYVTVDGADNPEDFADRFIRSMKLKARTV